MNKIYPLLEEYFYDEEDKIAKVLCCSNNKELLKDVRSNWLEILKNLNEEPAIYESLNNEE